MRQDDDWADPNGDSDNDGTKNKDDSDTGGGSSGGGEGGGSSGGGGGFTGTNPDLNPEGDNDDDGTLNKARRQQPSFKALCRSGLLV